MKSLVKISSILTMGLLLAFSASEIQAQSFDDILSEFTTSAELGLEDYTQPLGDVAALLSSDGGFHTGKSKGILGFDLGLKMVVVSFGSGDEEGILEANENVDGVGIPFIFANKGLPKGFTVGAKFSSLEISKDVGSLSLMGANLRWEANEIFHIPLLMPRIGLQANWNKMDIGDNFSTTSTSFDLIVSKSLAIIQPYIGYSIGSATTDVSYTPESLLIAEQDIELDSDISRLTLGLNVTPFPLLRINAAYTMADYNAVNVGLLFNLF
jgi:hypothetical protein